MPGIQVGDIGGKLGSNGNDNGWLMFDQVRIPRSDMFSRFSEVSREGSFKYKGDPRLNYQGMVSTRQSLLISSSNLLHRACLIATRYAVCRK